MSDPRRDFRRSSRFGLIGVAVVAVLAAALALLFGQGDANPTGVMIVIFVLIFGFVAALMYLQRRDLDAAAARSKLEAVAATEPVADPTVADQPSLLADLATGPIDDRAISAASGRMWNIARGSISSGAKMMVLIFCAVVPWQLFQFEWSLIVFVPLIVAYAAYLGARVIMPGGTLDQAYDDAGPTLSALGLSEAERPRVRIRRRLSARSPSSTRPRARPSTRGLATAARSASGSRAARPSRSPARWASSRSGRRASACVRAPAHRPGSRR